MHGEGPVRDGRDGDLLIQVWLYKGSGFVGKLIQWQTRSPYSHAAVAFDVTADGTATDAWILDAREGKGVKLRQAVAEDLMADRFSVDMTAQQETDVLEFLRRQVGKDYDYTMVARFISRRQESRKSRGKWFCSELVFAAFQHAGVDLLARCEPWEVSPGLLSRSPLLTEST